jgi:nucleotide-binding universal stress UspA family protein
MYKKILVAVDGSHTSKLAVQEAVKMASLTSGTVHAVYVVDKSPIFNYAGYFDPTVLTDALRSDGRNALENVEATCRRSRASRARTSWWRLSRSTTISRRRCNVARSAWARNSWCSARTGAAA